MQIGSLRIDDGPILAPLAGITDLPFRLLAKEAGAALVVTEMISAKGIVYKDPRTLAYLAGDRSERPRSVQIFGAVPDVMGEAAVVAAESGADAIDINFGCWVKKVVKTGAGVALMKDEVRAAAVIRAVRKAVTTPVTIKLRSGWDPSGDAAIRIARIAEVEGVNAVTVHPRTASQGFSGAADRRVIRRVKAALTIPVVGNGDITTPAEAVSMRAETGCDAVMIGRAAVGRPWLLGAIRNTFAGGPVSAAIPVEAQIRTMQRYLRLSVAVHGERRALLMMRSRLGWFSKGLKNAARFRESLKHVETEEEALSKIEDFREHWLEAEKNAPSGEN
jgi:nifR3 family TIM-barrel protein